MNVSISAAALLIAVPIVGAVAQSGQLPRDFRIESAHSNVGFSIGFLGFPVRGQFDDVRGVIAYRAGNPQQSSVSVVIPVKSLSTGSQHRDEHLRSADFFDAEKYPFITFHSTSIAREGKEWAMHGPLTMHGVTREVAIPFREVQPPIEEPHGSTLLVFSGRLRIARKDFGIMGGSKFNDWFDDVRARTMADSVDIVLDVQGWDPDYTRNKNFDLQLARIEREGLDSVLAVLRGRWQKDTNVFKDAEWEFTQIGAALLARGKVKDAIDELRFTTQVMSRSPTAHVALARALEASGQRAEALVEAQKAGAIDSFDPGAMELLRRLTPSSASERER
jgi:polyisoprenoid-binding protein YceI